MAWFALYKWFSKFRKTPYTNYITVYKCKLYDEWFNSLSEEDKNKVLKYQKEKREKRRKEVNTFFKMLECINSELYRISDKHNEPFW